MGSSRNRKINKVSIDANSPHHLSHRKNYYSQNGEDGVIDFLFKKLKINSGVLVEIGAWDGIHLSNTYRQFEKNKNLGGFLVESSQGRFRDLQLNFKNRDNVICHCAFVTPNNVNAFFSELNARSNDYNLENPKDFQLLSIDIDGGDWKAWQKLDKEKFSPKIIILEEGNWKNPEARRQYQDGFLEDGYNLVAITGNFIFVRNDLGFKNVDIEFLMKTSRFAEYEFYLGRITKNEMNEFYRKHGEKRVQANTQNMRTWLVPEDEIYKED